MATLIEGRDIFVRIVDLNGKVTEAVTENEDGTYTVFISARLDPHAQRERFEHALRHIRYCDFEKSDVQTVETAAHRRENGPSAASLSPDKASLPLPVSSETERDLLTVPGTDPSRPARFQREIRRLRTERRHLQRLLAQRQSAGEYLASAWPERYGSFLEITELPERY